MATNYQNKGLSMELGGVSLAQKAMLAKNFSLMLKSGLTVTESLDVLARTSLNGKLKSILTDIAKSVKAGTPLAESFARYRHIFSGFFIGSLYAGENSGKLFENLDIISLELTKEKELSAKIKNSLVYPLIVFVAAIILGIFLSVTILPKILPMLEGLRVKLPLSTTILITVSKFFKNHGTTFIISLVSALALAWWCLTRKWAEKFTDGLAIKLPLFKKLNKNLNVSRFCRTLGSMLKSGLNIVEALEITVNTLDNWHYKYALNQVRQGVNKGGHLSDYLVKYPDLFPEMAIRMIMVGEQSGRLEETLFYLADYYELEVDEAAKSLSAAIEPILLILIGLIVGSLALAIMGPVYSITGSLSNN